MTAPPDLSNITEGEGSAEEEDSADHLRRSLEWREPILAQCVPFSLFVRRGLTQAPQDDFGCVCCCVCCNLSPLAFAYSASFSAPTWPLHLCLDIRFHILVDPHPAALSRTPRPA